MVVLNMRERQLEALLLALVVVEERNSDERRKTKIDGGDAADESNTRCATSVASLQVEVDGRDEHAGGSHVQGRQLLALVRRSRESPL